RVPVRETSVKIVVRVAHVGVLRLVTDLRWKFGVPRMNVRNVRWQQRLIAVVPYRERKGQDLNKTGDVARGRASRSFPNAISSPSRITLRLVDLVHRYEELGRSDHKIGNTATELAGWTIVVAWRILNICESSDRETSEYSEEGDNFHRPSQPVK